MKQSGTITANGGSPSARRVRHTDAAKRDATLVLVNTWIEQAELEFGVATHESVAECVCRIVAWLEKCEIIST